MRNVIPIYSYILIRARYKTMNLLTDGIKHKLYSNFGEDNDYSINAPCLPINRQRVTDNITGLMRQQADGSK
jgi:hypothetical protein